MIEQLIKFGIVGGSGVFVDFGITWILKEKVKIHRYIANSTGFICAATSNYFLNRWWTFVSHNPRIEQEYGLFLLIAVAGLGINTAILHLFSEKAGKRFMPQNARLRFYMAKLIATAVVTLWNFFLNYFITFAK
jgi:putative flippase GtrA